MGVTRIEIREEEGIEKRQFDFSPRFERKGLLRKRTGAKRKYVEGIENVKNTSNLKTFLVRHKTRRPQKRF